jgi:hypothetical protein
MNRKGVAAESGEYKMELTLGSTICRDVKMLVRPGMVAHNYSPSYLGDQDRRTEVQGLPGQKPKSLYEKQTKRKRTNMVQVVE